MNLASIRRAAVAVVTAVALVGSLAPAHADTMTVPPTPPVPTCTVTLAAAPTKGYGTSTNVWGKALDCDDATVIAEIGRDGGWTRFGTADADENGNFVIDATKATWDPGVHELRARVGEAVSDFVLLERLKAPKLSTAGVKIQGESTNVWGMFPGTEGRSVSTEVRLANGAWSRSQTRKASQSGYFQIPLTYGRDASGEYSYRVVSTMPDGSVVRSEAKSITWLPIPTINTAGTRQVGLDSNAWGVVKGRPNVEVWTEVNVKGKWHRSQTTRTNSKGAYVLPLTYGKSVPGEYDHRVAARIEGIVVRSRSVTFTRSAKPIEGIDSRCMTGRVLCASKSQRKLYWMINGKIVRSVDARFARRGFNTREGVHKVFRKSRNHVSGIYHTRMPFAMFFSGGQAVHYSDDFARRGWNGGSAGCINVRDWNTLEYIFDHVRIGDKVVVYK